MPLTRPLEIVRPRASAGGALRFAGIWLLACMASLPVSAAQVQHLNTQTATASGAAAR